MKCNKCGHILPKDSVFCQYCGSNIEQLQKEKETVVVPKNAPNTDGREILASILTTQIVEGSKAVAANQMAVYQNLDDPEYGFVPKKPIYTNGIDGQEQYLQALRTIAGEPITWERRGSMSVEGVSGMIDIYDTFLPSGAIYRTLYINMYSPQSSKKAPIGFYYDLTSGLATKAPVASSTKSATGNNVAKAVSTPKSNYTSTPKTTNSPKTKRNRATIVVLAILLFISLVSNAFQLGVNIQAKNKVAGLDEQLLDAKKSILNQTNTIAELEEENAKQGDTIKEQQKKISNMTSASRFYNDIITNMKYGNSGYAANNFYATDSVIVVGKNETDRKFRLYANWSNGGTVEVDYSSNSAWVSFDDNEWYTWTDMTVHPSAKGVTIATFSNSVNSDTFKVLIIVTD